MASFLMSHAQAKKVLLFVAQDGAYYSEYIVCKAGLEAVGYQVDVRSAVNMPANTYMLPANTTIDATANALSGSSYPEFQLQFQRAFGATWNSSLNGTPSDIPVDGSILDIVNSDDYAGFAIAGGTGTISYRLDGTYAAQSNVGADTVELVAKKLNILALHFLEKGKPVLAQCHGAALPVFWRIPNTTGPDQELLGYSILKNQQAAGFPDANTNTLYSSLGAFYNASAATMIASPGSAFQFNTESRSRVITSRDWYPQTVSYATRTLLNIMESFPHENQVKQSCKVLVLHGGVMDSTNCHYTNLANDIPCNHAGIDPADYRHVMNLLNGNSQKDEFVFDVDELNMAEPNLPYDSNSAASFNTYISKYDAVIFYKHWSTHVRNEMMEGFRTYAENGGGIIALHHGLYARDEAGGASKRILTDSLFGAASLNAGFGISLKTYTLYATNYGHFVSTYGITYGHSVLQDLWNSDPTAGMNRSFSEMPSITIDDELYTNLSFTSSFGFGYDMGDITPLFSNNELSEPMAHTSGFVRHINFNNDSSEGRLVYLQPGERRENYEITGTYGQLIRNATFWASKDSYTAPSIPTHISKIEPRDIVKVYPNPTNGEVHLYLDEGNITTIRLFDARGAEVFYQVVAANATQFSVAHLPKGVYLLQIEAADGFKFVERLVRE